MSNKSTRVICDSSKVETSPRPERRNPFQITPSAYQEMKMAVTPPPAAVISLDAYDVKIIQEYRDAKAVWDKVLAEAEANRKPGSTLWQDQDMTAFEAADKHLRQAEVSMAALLDFLAKRAGV